MKKIFTTLALLGAFITAAVAQKNVDLKFSITTPANGATYANLNAGDTMKIQIKVENMGTAAVTATDTLIIYVGGYSFNTTNGQSIWRGFSQTGLNIAAGQSFDATLSVLKGSYSMSGTDTIINWFFNNDTNFLAIEGYGYDQNGDLFNDPGVNNANPEAQGALTGNNHSENVYILGTTTSANDVKLAKEAINVYPNPAVNEVNFDYTFKAATEASVRVLDITGREVYTQAFGKQAAGKQTLKVDVSGLQNGMYTIELITDNAKAVSKFNIAK